MKAKLDKTAEQLKTELRGMWDVTGAAPANPFGDTTDTAGDAGGNHFAHNTRYLKSHTSGMFKASQYLAEYDSYVSAVSDMVFDTLEQLEAEENELVEQIPDNVVSFLISAYVEKHAWKSGLVEETAANAYARSIGGRVIEQNDSEQASKDEKDSIDRRIEVDGEIVTVQVKCNTSAKVKKKNRDKVDILLRVDAKVDEREIEVTAEQVA